MGKQVSSNVNFPPGACGPQFIEYTKWYILRAVYDLNLMGILPNAKQISELLDKKRKKENPRFYMGCMGRTIGTMLGSMIRMGACERFCPSERELESDNERFVVTKRGFELLCEKESNPLYITNFLNQAA